MEVSHLLTMEQCKQLILLLSCLLLSSYFSCPAEGVKTISYDNNNVMCIDQEREALLKFKQGIQFDLCGLLSSWGDHEGNQNCCQWSGVLCSNYTGHVTMLSLRGADTDDLNKHCLQGKVSSALVYLKHLIYLDLSLNHFQQPLPGFIGSLVKLKHLNLSRSGFDGEIPHQLGNLSLLTSLDLGHMDDDYDSRLYVKELSWLSRLTLLRYINLNEVDLSKATDWLHVINNLPLLKVIYLNFCLLSSPVFRPSSFKNSSTTLSVLSLKWNNLYDSSIFQWLFDLSGINAHLSYLDLSENDLGGPIPSAFGNMHALSHLDLSENGFQGYIPSSFGNMKSLSYLDLSYNQLEGPIPDTISNLKLLTNLHLAFNEITLLPKTLGSLCSLQTLHLNSNNLTDELPNIIQSLIGCASMSSLRLSYNQIWGPVPKSVGTFSSLSDLFIDNNQLNGTIGQSLGKLSKLEVLDLSSNFLRGTLSNNHFSNLSRLNYLGLSNNKALVFKIEADWVPPFNLNSILLSNCRLGPLFPNWLLSQTNYSELDISCAGISDNIPKSFWKSMPSKLFLLNMSHNNIHGTLPNSHNLFEFGLTEIDMSHNNISGAVPSFPSNLNSLLLNDNKFSDPIPFMCPKAKVGLSNLDLSNNFLYGELPDCWMNFESLAFIRLENNNLSGSIPPSIGYLKHLDSLHLRNNTFSGELPRSLENLTSMVILDLGHNIFSGQIPSLVGSKLTSLSLLSLRSNYFVGGMPLSLCQLSLLQILDLSNNQITGTIPNCIHNLTAMRSEINFLPQFLYQSRDYSNFSHLEAATIMWKRKEWSFGKSLGLIKAIDISKNKLEGEIPTEISELKGLGSLILSRNNLIGSITPKIGQLTALEVLDLSDNHLSGEIPASLANLNSLGVLDLSNNSLSGKIPTNPQLQRFDVSSYVGNPELCGPPLPICRWDNVPHNNGVNEDNDESGSKNIIVGLYISVILGFILGFWGVCGTLLLKTSWRHVFFRYFDDQKDKLYIMVFVKIPKVLRSF